MEMPGADAPAVLLDHALAYAQRGWHVLPLEPRGKAPLGRLVPHGAHDATRDAATIERWWGDEPQANIGIALAPSRLVPDRGRGRGRGRESGRGRDRGAATEVKVGEPPASAAIAGRLGRDRRDDVAGRGGESSSPGGARWSAPDEVNLPRWKVWMMGVGNSAH